MQLTTTNGKDIYVNPNYIFKIEATLNGSLLSFEVEKFVLQDLQDVEVSQTPLQLTELLKECFAVQLLNGTTIYLNRKYIFKVLAQDNLTEIYLSIKDVTQKYRIYEVSNTVANLIAQTPSDTGEVLAQNINNIQGIEGSVQYKNALGKLFGDAFLIWKNRILSILGGLIINSTSSLEGFAALIKNSNNTILLSLPNDPTVNIMMPKGVNFSENNNYDSPRIQKSRTDPTWVLEVFAYQGFEVFGYDTSSTVPSISIREDIIMNRNAFINRSKSLTTAEIRGYGGEFGENGETLVISGGKNGFRGGGQLHLQDGGPFSTSPEFLESLEDTEADLNVDGIGVKISSWKKSLGTLPILEDLAEFKAGKISLFIPTFADNTAALAGELIVNNLYKTATGEIRIVV